MSAGDLRVRRSTEHADLLDRLQENVFDTFADALVFAACIGHRAHRRSPLKNPGEAIRYTVFVNRGLDSVVDLLAVAETDELLVLEDSGTESRITIFEELANGGLERIGHLIEEQEAKGVPSQDAPLEACIRIVEEFRAGVAPEDDLDLDVLESLID